MIFQVCSNGTRVFVHKSIMGPFLAQLVERTKRMKIGDPFHEDTTVGATISKQQFDIVMRYIELAKKEVYIKDICSYCSQIIIANLSREIENIQQIRLVKSFQMLHKSSLSSKKSMTHRILRQDLFYLFCSSIQDTGNEFFHILTFPSVHFVDFCFCVCREPMWCVVERE